MMFAAVRTINILIRLLILNDGLLAGVIIEVVCQGKATFELGEIEPIFLILLFALVKIQKKIGISKFPLNYL